MNFKIYLTKNANDQLSALQSSKDKKIILKAIVKTLSLMETNLRHQSLNTHKYNEIYGPKGEEVFESYVQNNTPGAYRIFWYYGPKRGEITVLEISPHPD